MKRSKEKNEEKRPLSCPFCGAPQRMSVPPGTIQINCEYCGGVILIPPWLGGKTLRCDHHPERLAIGICNDCGRSFCPECLRIYHLKTRDTETTLYLDTACLRKRHAGKASETIGAGILLLVFGVFSALVSVAVGILAIISAVAIIAYAFRRSREMPTESTVDEVLMERARIEADPALKERVNAEEVYNDLLGQYASRWGPRTGTELLREEIKGHLRQGASFAQAVKRIQARKRI